MSVWPIYLPKTFNFYPGLFSDKSIAFKFVLNIYIDLAQRTLPFDKLTTGSSDPIRTMTDP